MADQQIVLKATLVGHNGWVTTLATTPEKSDMIISGSRDKTLIVWQLTPEDASYGYPKKSLHGHGHFVSDVVISSDGQFALSGSWDGSLRLWDINAGKATQRFLGHKKDVLSVAFSVDNRQIVSASRDGTLRLWNTLGECKCVIDENCHSLWPSCVKFSPNTGNPLVVSGGWDKMVKVWNLTHCKLTANLEGHDGYINTVTISPDGSLCASGGREGTAFLWDLGESKKLYTLEAGACINALCFSPVRYWLCAATESGIKIWDLESKVQVAELKVNRKGTKSKVQTIEPLSLAWSADGTTLYAGYNDGTIRVWGVRPMAV